MIQNESKIQLIEMNASDTKGIIECFRDGEAQLLHLSQWRDIPHQYAENGYMNIDLKGIYRQKPKQLSVNELYEAVEAHTHDSCNGYKKAAEDILELIQNTKGYSYE